MNCFSVTELEGECDCDCAAILEDLRRKGERDERDEEDEEELFVVVLGLRDDEGVEGWKLCTTWARVANFI